MNKIFIINDQQICRDCLLHVQTSEKSPQRAAEGQRCSICSRKDDREEGHKKHH